MKTKAFTLIELLIVVAIIAILAAIAVPNFLEAQVRSKVSRCKSDMRTLATGLEAYKIDTNHYPPDQMFYNNGTAGPRNYLVLHKLTTPVAYVSSIPADLFVNTRGLSEATRFVNSQYNYYAEQNLDHKWGRSFQGIDMYVPGTGVPNIFVSSYGGKDIGIIWNLASIGPDRIDNWGIWAQFGGPDFVNRIPAFPGFGLAPGAIYDPTNGTLSSGDIIRVGP